MEISKDSVTYEIDNLPKPLTKSFFKTNSFPLPDKSNYIIADGSDYLFQARDKTGYRAYWTDYMNHDQSNILLFHLFVFGELSKQTVKRINGR